METTQLQEVGNENDFGMIVSDDLKWDKQCCCSQTSKHDTWKLE